MHDIAQNVIDYIFSFNTVSDAKAAASNGNWISGDNSLDHYGIYMNKKSKNTIRNCRVMKFYYGIFINNSDFVNIYGNHLTENNEGIKMENSNSTINSNTVCGNINLDFNSSGWQSSSGDNNTCDTGNWNNNRTSLGCFYTCSGLPRVCDLNRDGIMVKDYSELMAAYKCFLGFKKNCDTINYQDWANMKREYDCFFGNYN